MNVTANSEQAKSEQADSEQADSEQEPSMPGPDPATEAFLAHRNLLFTVAYEMLGSAADAEDVLQETWLRWAGVDLEQVRDFRAYLVRITARQALARLRVLGRRKESYVGPWLPEPLLTEAGPDPAERAELAESVSMAMLVVLESLTPDERAVFVLREVFGFSHAEIGAALGRPDAAVRQLAHRAREHVQARRPRFDVDWNQQREVTERFLAAAAGGDIEGLVSVLADDVTLLTDGGGKAKAALRPITGSAKVARFMAGIATRPYMGTAVSAMSVDMAEINGAPGTLISAGGHPVAVITMAVAGGRITAIQLLANPDKLSAIASGRTLSR
jgi:RNA polymerase sigma-70 factor (TIGR02957 family)